MKETFICSRCGQEHPTADRYTFDGQELCRGCYEAETCICDHCGSRIWTEASCGDENHTLCQNCADRYYDSCADCGRLVPTEDLRYLEDDDDEGYCDACYNYRIRQTGIHSYCYKPEPIFYGDGPCYFGVELEIDGGGEDYENACKLQNIANEFTDNIYIKHDGSLDEGMEIVTHPMSLNYHREGMPWREVLDKARHLGYTSHQAGTCGLHIHVNRDSLGEARQEQEDTIARILFLVETFWNELLRFSRRTQSQMDQWASRYGRKDDPKDVLHSAKNRADRYTCVNLLPHNTIEFRMFRGTLKYNTLIATLQLVETICNVASTMSDDGIKNLTWTEFVSNLYEDTVPELIQYLKERRLYVNEPVFAESEEV